MKKIKLPRKRKKRYIKDFSAQDYMAMRITNEVCVEHNDTPQARKFPHFSKHGHVLFNY